MADEPAIEPKKEQPFTVRYATMLARAILAEENRHCGGRQLAGCEAQIFHENQVYRLCLVMLEGMQKRIDDLTNVQMDAAMLSVMPRYVGKAMREEEAQGEAT